MVKVNRVESSLGISNVNPKNSRSSSKNDPKAETITHDDPDHLSGSGVKNWIPEGRQKCPEVTQVHPGINESRRCSLEPKDLSISQDCCIRTAPLEGTRLSSSSHTAGTSAETEMSWCAPESEAQTSNSSSRENTLSPRPNTNSSMDTCSGNFTNITAKPEKMDTVDPKHINPLFTTEALYDLKCEPAEGDSCTSCGSPSPSGHNCSLAKSSTKENVFPPLLQMNAIDMPHLTPEPPDKNGVCPLPPVLTQEMPSLTLADDGLTDIPKSRAYTHQVAPVLQRETPAGSPSSHEPKQEETETDLMMSKESLGVEHANNWHLDSPYNCDGAAMSSLERNAAHLSSNTMHKKTSGGVHEILIMPEIAAEKDHAKLENLTPGQSVASSCQLAQSVAPQTKQQPSLAELESSDNSKDPAQADTAFSLSSNVSLLTGPPKNNPHTPSPPVCSQNNSHSALQLHHNTYALSHCTSQDPYTEPKPFSSSIWKNFNSQGPAVLIQSLNPELPSVFTHDPLPYTMWTEPQCKEVTDLEDPEQDLRESANQEEEAGSLTWAQLEPTSLVSVGAAEHLGLCGDYELHKMETDGVEAFALCRELGRQKDAEENLHSVAALSPLVMGVGDQDGMSDMDDGGSDVEESEQQSSAKAGSSSDTSDEEEEEEDEENDTRTYKCNDSDLEPGEVCAVSV